MAFWRRNNYLAHINGFKTGKYLKICWPYNACQQCFLEVTNFCMAIPKISVDNLTVEDMYSIHFRCPVYVEDLETCIHVHHWLATNDINYSDGFTQRLW
jgi:hypothetical protein